MRRTYYDDDNRAYYDLLCDDCGSRYRSHTDAYYDWRLLTDEAAWSGWHVADRGARGQHRCPDCAMSKRRVPLSRIA